MTIAIGVPSKRLGVKDIVNIEDCALDSREVNKIALVAPNATVNIVRNYVVVEKIEVKLPSIIKDTIKCKKSTCISNSNESVDARFYVETEEPLLLKRHYCGQFLEKADIWQQF